MHLPEPRVFAPTDRPAVKVMVLGRWTPGELRAWNPTERNNAVTWVASVQYRTMAGDLVIEDFERDEIRVTD